MIKFVHIYLIADSDKYGKDQIISSVMSIPLGGCMVSDELERSNKKIVMKALKLASKEGYTNIREVRNSFKETFDAKQGIVSHKHLKETIVKFNKKHFGL